MKSRVNEQSIRKSIKSSVSFYETLLAGVIIVGLVVIITFVSPENREWYAAWLMFPLFVVGVLTHFLGRYTNLLRKKVCIDWYEWDKGRIAFFKHRQVDILNKYQEYLNNAVSIAIQKNPENVAALKKVTLEMLHNLKNDFATQRAAILMQLNESDLELVQLLQLKARVDDAEERIEAKVIDFFADSYREEQNPELLRVRLEKALNKEMQWWLNEKLDWYENLIISCQESTQALAVILKNDYKVVLSE